LLGSAPDVFAKGAQKLESSAETIQQLHAKNGQLTMKNDFLERGLERIHGARGKK
jgi:transposase